MFITSRNLPIVNFSPLKRIYMNSRRGYNNIKNGSVAIMSGYTPQLTCTASLMTYMYTYLPRWASLLLGGTGFSPHWSALANYTMYVQYMYMYQPLLGTTHLSQPLLKDLRQWKWFFGYNVHVLYMHNHSNHSHDSCL